MPINVSSELTAQQQITAIYVAYYDRAPDPAGIQFWVDQLEGGRSLEQIASDFSSAAETVEKYPYFETPELASADNFITSVYVNLFGRTPDSAGLDFWSDQLESGSTPVGEIILAIIEGAQDVPGGDDDRSTVLNKIDVGLDWATAAANAGVGTSSNLIAEDVDGNLVVHDPDAFTSATTVLDGVTGDPATVDAAKGDTDTFFEENVDIGETFNLTTGQDDVSINTVNTIDTVRGLLDDDGTNDNDTFTSGDIIEGNGLTEVRLTLVEVDSGTPDFVEMTGVNGLEFRGAGESSTVTFDASTYGSDLNNFTLSGGDNPNVVVDDVEFDEGVLTFAIAEGTAGDLDVSGETGPFTTFTADLDTTGAEGAYIISDIGNTGIDVFAGADADVDFDATVDVSETGGNSAIIDALDVGDVSIVGGEDSDVELTISLSASATSSGAATVGDVTVGAIAVTGGLNSSIDATINRYAYADDANATIGNLTVGDIAFDVGEDADISLDFYASASATGVGDASVGDSTFGDVTITGADVTDSWTLDIEENASADTGMASIGNLTMGDVSMIMGESHDSSDFWIDRSASVSMSGDAVVGDITIGNIGGVLGDFGDETEFTIEQDAYADTGNAAVGAIAIGDISFDMGEDTDIEFSVSNSASATQGDASVGDVTVGAIDLVQASGATFDLEIDMNADASGSGSGVVGNLTVGDITSVMDIQSTLDVEIDVTASGTGTMTAIGDVAIGNMTLSGPVAIDAEASLDVSLNSDGKINSLAVGAVAVDFLSDSTYDYDIYANADGSIGVVDLDDVNVVAESIDYEVTVTGADLTSGVTIGDVILSGDDIDWSGMDIYASGDIGDVDIGNIMLDANTNLYVINGIDVSASGDVGNVTVGDIAIQTEEGDNFDVYVSAGDDIGNVSIGNMEATVANTYMYMTVTVSGDQDVGDVSIGNIALSAAGSTADADAGAYMIVDGGTGDSVGNVTVGDISLVNSATGAAADSGNWVSAWASIGGAADTVGDVVFGDLTSNVTIENIAAAKDATSDYAGGSFYIDANQGSDISSMTVGDINLSLTNSVDSSTAYSAADEFNVAYATAWVDSDSAITVGDINISAMNTSTVDVQNGIDPEGLFSIWVSLTAASGTEDITIGDITIAGGSVDTASATLDGLANLTGWLYTDGSTVTVGDIDYSSYEAASTIDVSGFEGAANITASAGGSDITVNTTQNMITLGAGDDTVIYEADEDAGTTYADIDKISGFESGSDLIDFSSDLDITNVDVGGTVADYDAFLVAAQNAMSFDSSIDVFAMTDGTNTYVAVESDDDASDTIDYAIELTGITSVGTADFVV